MRKWIIGVVVLVGLGFVLAFVLLNPSGARGSGQSAAPMQVTVDKPQAPQHPLQGTEAVPDDVQRSVVPVVDTDDGKNAESAASEPEFVAHLIGRCLDRRGLPVAEVEVKCRKSRSLSEADGSFVLDVDLKKASRKVEVQFSVADFGNRDIELRISADETIDMGDVVLEGAAVVFGVVVSEEGAPLSGVKVQLEAGDSASSRSRFTGHSDALRSTKTAADGTFLFERVAPGAIQVSAGLRDYFWSSSEPHELVAVEEHEVELTLERLESEDTIDLLVVDPEGRPVPLAKVLYQYDTSRSSGSGTELADGEGRLRLFLEPRCPRSFVASGPSGKYGVAIASDVPPGTHDLIMQLAPLELFSLSVTSSTGAPIERFSAKIHSVERQHNSITAVHDSEHHPEGKVDVAKPPFEFRVVVRADGHAVVESPLYVPETMPSFISVRLDALPAVRGIVTGDGRALLGAKVSLHRAAVSETTEHGTMYDQFTVNGNVCRSQKSSSASGPTSADGRFALTLRKRGMFYLRAKADGFAPRDVGPFELDPTLGASGLQIELGRGGTVSGRVLVNPGQKLEGWSIGASRGDGFGVTLRTDETGAFRFERLAAGRWLIEQRDTEISPNSTSSTSGRDSSAAVIPSTCDVYDSVTTNYDIDLRSVELGTLVGRLLFDGKPPERARTWKVRFTEAGDFRALHEVFLDGDGGFRFAVPRSGKFTLEFDTTSGSVALSLRDEVTLAAGANHWEHDFATGALEVQLAPTMFDWSSRVSYKWEGAGKLTFGVGLTPNTDGLLHVSPVPAGPGVLHGQPKSGDRITREVVVPRGGTLSVQLP